MVMQGGVGVEQYNFLSFNKYILVFYFQVILLFFLKRQVFLFLSFTAAPLAGVSAESLELPAYLF